MFPQKYSHKLIYSILFVICTLMASCSSIGPSRISMDRTHYRDVVQETNFEQVLKNIVQLRYLEGSAYFQVSSVIASYSLAESINGMKSSNSAQDFVAPWSVSGAAVYSDSPTISYTPVGGSAFAASLENPIKFEHLILLSQGGDYNFELLAKLVISRIGPLENSPSAINITTHKAPNYKEFYKFVGVLSKMLHNETAISTTVLYQNKHAILIHFTQKNSADALLLKRMVHVPADSDSIIFMAAEKNIALKEHSGRLVEETPKHFDNVVNVQTRSLNAVLIFLSHGVIVPEEDVKKHFTSEMTTEDNTIYDWTPVMHNIITIHSSVYNPVLMNVRTLTRVEVDKNWFYIESSDVRSKETFILTLKLFELVSLVHENNQTPTLTLPAA